MSLFLRYINLYYSVERNICKLNKMPHLKIVLVGFDYLFSEILILACKIKNIETIAVQERMLLLWLTGTKILFDHYFIIGSPVKKLIVEQQNGVKQSLYEIGPIRMTQHYDAQNTINDVLKKEVLDFKWCVLSLDYNSTPDYYANGIRHISNWKSNLSFYTTIFNLSKEFNEAKFFIKGKNNDFINIPFFKEIIDEINKRINCEIVNDFDLWTPFTAVSICDITIARHTSLGDEILALGKPVIFYDCYGFPSKVMDYGPRVISYSYDDLEKKLRDFFSDSTSYNNKLNSVRRKFYTVPKIPVKQVLDKKLEEIYTLSCNR